MAYRFMHYYFDDILIVIGCQITQGLIKLFLGSFLTSPSPPTFERSQVPFGMQSDTTCFITCIKTALS